VLFVATSNVDTTQSRTQHSIEIRRQNAISLQHLDKLVSFECRFHRILKEHTNMKNTSTDDGVKPEKVYKQV
jgi:hypothetical protein